MKIHHSVAPKAVAPEIRLKPLLFSAPAFAVALFWVAFTSYSSISIASPILALTLLGGCILFIFLGCFNYLIDTYLMNAASALSINSEFWFLHSILPSFHFFEKTRKFSTSTTLTLFFYHFFKSPAVVRSTLGASFPLFAVQMYNKLGVPGATALLGGLAVLFVPVPFFLMKYGRKIRELSKNAIILEEL